jgi:hypothetical protein
MMADEEAFRARMSDAKSGLWGGLVLSTIGTVLWLVMPEGFAPDQTQAYYLVIVGLGIVVGLLGYLDLRACHLGTERARQQAHIAKLVTRTAGVLFCLAFSALMLALLGLMIIDWITGMREGFPFLAANYFAHIPIIFVIFLAMTWIERPARTPAGLVAALIAFSVLLAADIAVGGFMVWDGLQIAEERELPMLIAFMHASPNLLVAGYLFLAIPAVVSRLRGLVAYPRA